jgi:hypothetical protein
MTKKEKVEVLAPVAAMVSLASLSQALQCGQITSKTIIGATKDNVEDLAKIVRICTIGDWVSVDDNAVLDALALSRSILQSNSN